MCGISTKWRHSTEVILSYLPLSHVAAQIVDIYCPLLYAASVYFAQPDALKVFFKASSFVSLNYYN